MSDKDSTTNRSIYIIKEDEEFKKSNEVKKIINYKNIKALKLNCNGKEKKHGSIEKVKTDRSSNSTNSNSNKMKIERNNAYKHMRCVSEPNKTKKMESSVVKTLRNLNIKVTNFSIANSVGKGQNKEGKPLIKIKKFPDRRAFNPLHNIPLNKKNNLENLKSKFKSTHTGSVPKDNKFIKNIPNINSIFHRNKPPLMNILKQMGSDSLSNNKQKILQKASSISISNKSNKRSSSTINSSTSGNSFLII